MNTRIPLLLAATALLAGWNAAAQSATTDAQATAPLFYRLGEHHYPVTTTPRAQRYFDQGLILAYAFNHAEAKRSFIEAARLDRDCALCWWGAALVLGPNINKPMDPADNAEALGHLLRAKRAAAGAGPSERALIEALTARYAHGRTADRTTLDLAYASAMREVAKAYRDDADIQVLFAEALMDTMPWDYWADPETPRPATREVLTALERALALDPAHPGANHLYIHAIEPSSTPERAEAAAEMLDGLVPGAGHLVHMPAHIYLRVGRYADASRVNVAAAAADEAYIAQSRGQGFYPAAYYPHNIHFLWASATLEGRRQTATEAAEKLAAVIPAERVAELPMLEELVVTPLYAYERFGDWEAILAADAPPAQQRFSTAIWHYARGRAHAARGELDAAGTHREALAAIADDAGQRSLGLWSGATRGQILDLASVTLAAAMAAAQGEHELRIAHLRDAAALESTLAYSEPAPWYRPVHQELGAALLDAGRAGEAEAAYRQDLAVNRRNGWSLAGLTRSLRAQGRIAEAGEAEAEFKAAWREADHDLGV